MLAPLPPPPPPLPPPMSLQYDQLPAPPHTHDGAQRPAEQQPDLHCALLVHAAVQAHVSPPQLATVGTSVELQVPPPVLGGWQVPDAVHVDPLGQ